MVFHNESTLIQKCKGCNRDGLFLSHINGNGYVWFYAKNDDSLVTDRKDADKILYALNGSGYFYPLKLDGRRKTMPKELRFSRREWEKVFGKQENA